MANRIYQKQKNTFENILTFLHDNYAPNSTNNNTSRNLQHILSDEEVILCHTCMLRVVLALFCVFVPLSACFTCHHSARCSSAALMRPSLQPASPWKRSVCDMYSPFCCLAERMCVYVCVCMCVCVCVHECVCGLLSLRIPP